MRITLISMPWAIFYRPSIQLGALSAYLEKEAAVHSHCVHLYLDIARAVGFDLYNDICASTWAGEAIFSALLFPDNRDQAERLFIRELPTHKNDFSAVLATVEKTTANWLAEQDFQPHDLVGFSICFSQLLASLYCSSLLKKNWPQLSIVFGGSACTPALGQSLLRSFPWLDFLIIGEGEQALAGLIHHLAANDPLPDQVLTRQKPSPSPTATTGKQLDLDTLPCPDYDQYFKALARLGQPFVPELPIEFSRGCWWNKCSFCNLNQQWCGYRQRKHDRVLADVLAMAARYQCLDFFFTDNALPPAEAGDFFRKIQDTHADYRFFAEIRVPRDTDECRRYQKGGLRSIQVGIEALSGSLLDKMCKGTTVMENIHAMKMAMALHIRLDGNLILEFPGSTEEEVRETLRVLRLILPYRPLQAAAFFLGQGSPVYDHPHQYGISAITHHANDRLLFPRKILAGLDLLVKGYRGDRTRQKKLWRPVREQIKVWQRFHLDRRQQTRPALELRDGGDFLLIRQERPGQPALHHRMGGLSRKIYLACEKPIEKKRLLARFKTVKEDQLHQFLAGLEQKGLLYDDGSTCLALAISHVIKER